MVSLTSRLKASVDQRLRGRPDRLEQLVHWRWRWARRWVRSRPHRLTQPLYITLTSYGPRLATLLPTLKCLLMQSCAPDAVFLWIDEKEIDQLPADVQALRAHGLQIRSCTNLKSYKKIIPLLREAPHAYLVTADDDCYYPPDWLDQLVQASRQGRAEAVCHRAHRIRVDASNRPLPYLEWELHLKTTSVHSLNFMTGVGGVLYPPGCFAPEVTDESLFMRLCADCDDVWLWWMLRRNGYVVRKVGGHWPVVNWNRSQQASLYELNVTKSGNDVAIERMVEHFGFPTPAATPETTNASVGPVTH